MIGTWCYSDVSEGNSSQQSPWAIFTQRCRHCCIKSADLAAKSTGSRICTAEVGTEAKRAARHCRTESVARHPPVCWAWTLTGSLAVGAWDNVGFTASASTGTCKVVAANGALCSLLLKALSGMCYHFWGLSEAENVQDLNSKCLLQRGAHKPWGQEQAVLSPSVSSRSPATQMQTPLSTGGLLSSGKERKVKGEIPMFRECPNILHSEEYMCPAKMCRDITKQSL